MYRVVENIFGSVVIFPDPGLRRSKVRYVSEQTAMANACNTGSNTEKFLAKAYLPQRALNRHLQLINDLRKFNHSARISPRTQQHYLVTTVDKNDRTACNKPKQCT